MHPEPRRSENKDDPVIGIVWVDFPVVMGMYQLGFSSQWRPVSGPRRAIPPSLNHRATRR